MTRKIKTLVNVFTLPDKKGIVHTVPRGTIHDATETEHGDAVINFAGMSVTLIRKFAYIPEFVWLDETTETE